MHNFAGLVLGLAIGAGLVLLVLAGIWWLWCLVLPTLWPTGPEQLINPGYWIFVAAWILFGFIGRQLFGRSSKD